MKKLICFALIVLAGCATQPEVKPNNVVLATEKQTVVIPEEQTTPCPDLPMPELKAMSKQEVVTFFTTMWYLPASSCALNHNALIVTAKKAFNIKAQPADSTDSLSDSSSTAQAAKQ